MSSTVGFKSGSGTSRLLIAVVLGVALASGAAALTWSARNPRGSSWDESEYLNRVAQDRQVARTQGLLRAARLTRWSDVIRPPAYRLAALPLVRAFGPRLGMLRAVSLAALCATCLLLYLGVRGLVAPSIALTVAALFGLSYGPIWASAHFGTEYVLYPAVAGLFCALLWCTVHPERAGLPLAVGLAAALAVGALSKSSFPVVAAPAVLAFLAVGWWRRLPRRALWAVVMGSIGGLLVAAPWWTLNFRSAWEYAAYASRFVRGALPWLPSAFGTLFGPPVMILLAALLLAVLWRWRALRGGVSSQGSLALAVCAAGALPLLAVHILGANHDMRLVSPALIPLVLGVAILMQGAGLTGFRTLGVVSLGLALQGAYVTRHFLTFRIDQWDLEGLHALVEARGIRTPLIAHLGNGITFNPAALVWPWVRRDEGVREEWLWRFEEGPIDWSHVERAADSADVLVTAPDWRGEAEDQEPLDNQHNAEFVRRLEASGRYDPPDTLRLGDARTTVLVFFRKRIPPAVVQAPPAGPLRVSRRNSRYFETPRGTIVYLTGAHTWNNLVDADTADPPRPFDYERYLAFLRARGHNFFRLWAWEQSAGSLEYPGHYYFAPPRYPRPGPGAALDGKPRFDLTGFNPAYFARLRRRVQEAGAQGMYVSIMLFNGFSVGPKGSIWPASNPWRGSPFNGANNINGVDGDLDHNGSGDEVQTLAADTIVRLEEGYVRHVVDAVNDLDNVLFEIVNEGDSSSVAWQYHMIRFLHQYEVRKPKQHPVGMTAAYPNGSNVDLFASAADWISPNGPPEGRPPADGTKVILDDTDHLCGLCGTVAWVWESFTQGENPIFMDQYDGEAVGTGAEEDARTDSRWEGIRWNLGYARSFAERMDLARARPAGDLSSTGYCLAVPGSEYLVFAPEGGVIRMNLAGVGDSVSVQWFDPRSGSAVGAPAVGGGRVRDFVPPFSGDAVLYLRHRGRAP